MRKILAVLALASLAACFSIPRPRTPVTALTFEHTGEVPSRTLIVLLPGRFNAPEEFVEQGFVDAMRERGLAADLRIVDAHLGYYINRVFEKRLREDVFREAGGHEWPVWLKLWERFLDTVPFERLAPIPAGR